MIALFDSGYGGLTVFKPLLALMPEYDYLYLGDNARNPYGGHSQEAIQSFSEQAVDYLFKKGAKLIIFACNTASSAALRYVQQKYLNGKDEKNRKILGVLIPVAEKAIQESKTGRIGIVGTRATVESNAYENEILKLTPGVDRQSGKIMVYQKACPLLVPFIEENWHQKPEATSILKKYLKPLKSCNIDTLILGCTHYPLMKKNFQRIMGKKVNILESGPITAQATKNYLARHPEIEKKLTKKGTRAFLTTDCPDRMQEFAKKQLGMTISKPEKVSLT